jgi:hypothetical protein
MGATVFIQGENGHIFTMSLPLSEPIEDRLTKGYLLRVNADGTPWSEGKRDMPAPYASKTDWVGFAVSKGAIPDDAEALTKNDLIEMYGVPNG